MNTTNHFATPAGAEMPEAFRNLEAQLRKADSPTTVIRILRQTCFAQAVVPERFQLIGGIVGRLCEDGLDLMGWHSWEFGNEPHWMLRQCFDDPGMGPAVRSQLRKLAGGFVADLYLAVSERGAFPSSAAADIAGDASRLGATPGRMAEFRGQLVRLLEQDGTDDLVPFIRAVSARGWVIEGRLGFLLAGTGLAAPRGSLDGFVRDGGAADLVRRRFANPYEVFVTGGE